MTNVFRSLQLLCCLLLPPSAWADTAPAGEAAPPPATSALPASQVPEASAVPANVAAASAEPATIETASAPSAASAVTAPPPPEGCRPTTFKAMAADRKAFDAQRDKLELGEQVRLFDAALVLWGMAVEQCEGRARTQAQNNLANSKRARDAIGEQLNSGEHCVEIHKDAKSFQGMGKQALSEQRWNDAAILFHKSADLWEMASEYCTGKMQEVADKLRTETEQDAYNAEYCAPLFARAREHTQKLRATSALLGAEEKRNLSMEAETLWRDAADHCMGTTVQDMARNNALALGRERGTPWVARRPAGMAAPTAPPPAGESGTAAAPSPQAQESAPAKTASAVPASATEPPSKKKEASLPVATATAVATQTAASTAAHAATQATSAAARAAAKAAPIVEEAAQASLAATTSPAEFKAEHAAGLGEFSGKGKITWAIGDVYEGDIVKGLRQGKGRLTWANGQRYEGDWQGDKATGQGTILYPNGDRYEGSVRDALPHGQGRMQYANGDRYSGNFNAGTPDGTGSYAWKNGRKYEGTWRGGHPNGQGRMDFPTGENYVGNFLDGKPDGQGTYHFLNGDQYNGEWKAGKKHGQGSYIWKNGNHWEGRFENDQRVGGESKPAQN